MFSMKSSVVNICSNEKNDDQTIVMINKFVNYLLKSKKLKHYLELASNTYEIIDVCNVIEIIYKSKHLDRKDKLLNDNMTACLESIRIINVIYIHFESMRLEAFDIYNENHTNTLEKFWVNLKEEPRKIMGFISPEWIELGFQGDNPSTDFRSMGYLSLYQLYYFTINKPDVAKLILNEWSHPSNVFPFAIIGINLTRLIMELFKEKRFHRHIIQNFGYLSINTVLHRLNSDKPSKLYPNGPSNDTACIEYCSDLIHRIYCIAFEEFYLIWIMRKPTSIMDFNKLYSEVQDLLFERYPLLTCQ